MTETLIYYISLACIVATSVSIISIVFFGLFKRMRENKIKKQLDSIYQKWAYMREDEFISTYKSDKARGLMIKGIK